jgi:uncharacterized cupredoxin-like copper-binding protein
MRPRVCIPWLAVLALLAGCGTAPRPPGTLVGIRLEDFAVKTTRTSLRAGVVTFRVANDGPSTHELLVVRTDAPIDALPFDSNGLRVDEESPRIQIVKTVETLLIGDRSDLTVTLPAGRYVLFCNLEGHYLSRMRAEIDVR